MYLHFILYNKNKMSITILNIKQSIKTLMENYKIPYEAIEDLEE